MEGLAQVVRLRGAVDAVAPGDRSADGAVAPAELGEPQGLVVAVAEHDVADGGDAADEAPAPARPGVERRAVVAVGVDRPPVEVALDAVLVELLGELVVGVRQRPTEDRRVRVGGLRGRVGGLQHVRVVADLVRGVEEVVLVGLVPDLPGGNPVAVPADHEGERVGVVGGVHGRVVLHVAIPPLALAVLLQRVGGGGGPAGGLREGEEELQSARLRAVDDVVDPVQVPGLVNALAVLLDALPADVDADHVGSGRLRRVEHLVRLRVVDAAP